MQDDSNYDALQRLYNNRNTKDADDFSTLSDTDQEDVYGQMLREVDTHEFDDEDIQHESTPIKEEAIINNMFSNRKVVTSICEYAKESGLIITESRLKEKFGSWIVSRAWRNMTPKQRTKVMAYLLAPGAAVTTLLFMTSSLIKDFIKKKKATPAACKHLSGDAKKACIKKGKQTAIKSQINFLKSSLNGVCPKSKNPDKCKKSVNKKIDKLQKDLRSL